MSWIEGHDHNNSVFLSPKVVRKATYWMAQIPFWMWKPRGSRSVSRLLA